MEIKLINESFFDDVDTESLKNDDDTVVNELVDYTHHISIDISDSISLSDSNIVSVLQKQFGIFSVTIGNIEVKDYDEITFDIQHQIKRAKDIDLIRKLIVRSLLLCDRYHIDLIDFKVISKDNEHVFKVSDMKINASDVSLHNSTIYLVAVCDICGDVIYNIRNQFNDSVFIYLDKYMLFSGLSGSSSRRFTPLFSIGENKYGYITKTQLLEYIKGFDKPKIYLCRPDRTRLVEASPEDIITGKYQSGDELELFKKLAKKKVIWTCCQNEKFSSYGNIGVLTVDYGYWGVISLCDIFEKSFLCSLVLVLPVTKKTANERVKLFQSLTNLVKLVK